MWHYASALKPTRGPLATRPDFWANVDELFTPHPSYSLVSSLVELLTEHSSTVATLHQLLLETLSTRLQFLGEFRAGTALRRAMAQNRVTELRGIPLESPLWLKHLLGAYAYLDCQSRLNQTGSSQMRV